MITKRLSVSERKSLMTQVPLIQPGITTVWFRGEKMERTACCNSRLMPKVASRVSSGRP